MADFLKVVDEAVESPLDVHLVRAAEEPIAVQNRRESGGFEQFCLGGVGNDQTRSRGYARAMMLSKTSWVSGGANGGVCRG